MEPSAHVWYNHEGRRSANMRRVCLLGKGVFAAPTGGLLHCMFTACFREITQQRRETAGHFKSLASTGFATRAGLRNAQ